MAAKGRGGGKTPERVVALLQEEVAKSSQAATSRATGLTLQTVQRYIKGIGEPSQATLEKLAVYFKKPVWWLRGGNTGALSSTNSLMPENNMQEAAASFQFFLDTLALTAENKLSKEDLQESYDNIINILVSKYNTPEDEVRNFVKSLLDGLTKSLLNFTEKELSKIDAESGNRDTP